MKNHQLTLLCLLAISFFLGSCKVYRNVENLKPKTSEEVKAGPFEKSEFKKLVPGDKILLITTTEFKYYMVYQNYTGDHLVGSVWKLNEEKLETPQKTEIPFEEIDQIRVLRVSAAATVPVVLVSLFVAVAGGFLLVFALGGGLDLGF